VMEQHKNNQKSHDIVVVKSKEHSV